MRKELGPIAVHIVVVLTIEASLLIIGLLTRELDSLLPRQHSYWELVERLDAWTALSLLSLFGAYTILIIAVRLSKTLASEVENSKSPRKEVSPDE